MLEENNPAITDDKDTRKFPTSFLIGVNKDRKTTSIWVSESIHRAFVEACELSGRRSCDVLEPFERAYVEVVRKAIIENEILSCPFQPLVVNLTLNITEKYAKRGPQAPSKWVEFCPVSGRKIDSLEKEAYCRYVCRLGGQWSAIQDPKYSHLYSEALERGVCAVFRKILDKGSVIS